MTGLVRRGLIGRALFNGIRLGEAVGECAPSDGKGQPGPLNLRQSCGGTLTGLENIGVAVFGESAPLIRVVQCLMVANMLLIGFEARKPVGK